MRFTSARAALQRRLGMHQLEVSPPAELWDRSKAHHQSAAGRTPSQPALLAATALARAVHNVSAAHAGGVAYVQLAGAMGARAFDWELDPRRCPGVRTLLARGVTDGIIAEAVAERFAMQRTAALAAAGRVRCSAARCSSWALTSSPTSRLQTMCCEELQPAYRSMSASPDPALAPEGAPPSCTAPPPARPRTMHASPARHAERCCGGRQR